MDNKDLVNPFTGETIKPDYLDRRGQPMTPWGAEILDPIPVAPPIGYKRQPTMVEHIREMVRSERLRQEAEAAGAESFEESEDFDVGEDDDPQSVWENEYDPPINELREAVEAERAKKATPPSESPEAAPAASPAPSSMSSNGPVAPKGDE